MEPLVVDASNIPQRAERPNPEGLSKLELAEKDAMVDEMIKRHPKIPPKWLEWLYDTWKRKGEGEMQRIIDSGEWDKPLVERNKGGVIKDAMEVIPHDEVVEPKQHTPQELGELETDENGELVM